MGTLRNLALVGLALVVGLGVLQPVPSRANAHEVPYGWWSCTQNHRTGLGPVYIGMPPSGATGAFPATGYGDGVANSFADRIADAAASWNSQVIGAAAEPYGVIWTGENYSVNVQVQYKTIPVTDGFVLFGITNLPTSCTTVHGTATATPTFITVDINIRSDWFTQDNSRRALWENCPASGSTAYTCSKVYDFGSVIVHELGHAMGLAHPTQVDAHLSSPSAASLAKCAVVNDQSTMCQSGDASGGGAYRTHRRTLDTWDVQSLTFALP